MIPFFKVLRILEISRVTMPRSKEVLDSLPNLNWEVKEGFLEEVTVKLRVNDEQALFRSHVTNFHFYRGL